MASRCGVFTKTDLQNLLSREVPREDIAASVFHAVVLQTIATLALAYCDVMVEPGATRPDYRTGWNDCRKASHIGAM